MNEVVKCETQEEWDKVSEILGSTWYDNAS